jgi:hypothetical protein
VLILAENNILVPLGRRLPHAWNILAGGYAVPPILAEGLALNAYIEHLPPEQRDHPDYVANNALWVPLFQQEQ